MPAVQPVLVIAGFILLTAAPPAVAADPGPLRDEATSALRRAATFYRSQVASHGGYVYYYSVDLTRRFGEGPATLDQIWVQPPGTPTVGLAYLKAWEATGDRFYLDAAREAAEALVHGQLVSGGWTNAIDFDPRGSKVAQYRNGRGRGRNFSTLDDGISQAAIRLLVNVDRALEFKHEAIHEAARVALDALLAAQFPNGGFPQGWDGPVPRPEIVRANYPEYDWRTEGRIKEYWDYYTLNDGVAGNVAATLIDAHRVYGDRRYADALTKLGDFLLLAQMPDPQPGWAQQYNYDMQPIWARRFEPPAVSGWESQDALDTLLTIYAETGDRRYLEPFRRTLAWLRKSLLPDGRVARYYELRTNRPLYMSRANGEYTLTHDDSRLPDHYGWKMPARLDTIAAEYERLQRNGRHPAPASTPAELEPRVRQIVADLDDQGRWISTFQGQRLPGDQKFRPGDRFIGSDVFSENVETLSAYLSAIR